MIEVGVLRQKQWPESHAALWEAGIRPPLLPLDPRGAGATWRRDTIKMTAAAWGRWCFFLVQVGWFDDALPPDNLVTYDRLIAYLKHLAEHNKPSTILTRIIGLERALAVLAPKADRSLLRRIVANLNADYEPISKRERLQESAALVELGFDLMNRARAARGKRRRRHAAMYRDGLQIALLAMRPIRLKNFSSIRIGRHLDTVGGVWWLEFPGAEMKNHEPIAVEFPAALVEALEYYLDVIRNDLADGRYHGDALWISHWWRQQNNATIYGRLCKRTQEEFGLPITPHLFRDCAATSLAVHAPDEVQIAHLILGNSYAMMQKHYNLARGIDAVRHVNAAMDRFRSQRS